MRMLFKALEFLFNKRLFGAKKRILIQKDNDNVIKERRPSKNGVSKINTQQKNLLNKVLNQK